MGRDNWKQTSAAFAAGLATGNRPEQLVAEKDHSSPSPELPSSSCATHQPRGPRPVPAPNPELLGFQKEEAD